MQADSEEGDQGGREEGRRLGGEKEGRGRGEGGEKTIEEKMTKKENARKCPLEMYQTYLDCQFGVSFQSKRLIHNNGADSTCH